MKGSINCLHIHNDTYSNRNLTNNHHGLQDNFAMKENINEFQEISTKILCPNKTLMAWFLSSQIKKTRIVETTWCPLLLLYLPSGSLLIHLMNAFNSFSTLMPFIWWNVCNVSYLLVLSVAHLLWRNKVIIPNWEKEVSILHPEYSATGYKDTL